MYSYYFCQNLSSFKIKKKPNTPMTAAAAEAKNNNSNKQTEYKLIVGCCMIVIKFTYKCCTEKNTVYYMKYDRQPIRLFYGLLHTNRTN